MARQTRQQRRERRERSAAAEPQQRAQQRQAPARPLAEQAETPAGGRQLPAAGTRRFVGESVAELRKVEWPGQKQVMQGTVVVIIACAIVDVYLWGADLVLRRFVENILLGQ